MSLSSSAREAGRTATERAGGSGAGSADGHRRALGGQRVAGAGAGQAGHGHEVAGHRLGHRWWLVAPQGLEHVEPLVGRGSGCW